MVTNDCCITLYITLPIMYMYVCNLHLPCPTHSKGHMEMAIMIMGQQLKVLSESLENLGIESKTPVVYPLHHCRFS